MLLKKTALTWLWLSAFIVVIDQTTKYWVVTHLFYQQSVYWLPFLNITRVYNSGAAFAFLSTAGGWQIYFFATVALLIAIVFMVWLKRTPRGLIWRSLGLALIIGGALGNFIDRIYLNYVVDFIDFHIGNWHFATFNVADSAVSVGAFCLMVSILLPQATQRHSQ